MAAYLKEMESEIERRAEELERKPMGKIAVREELARLNDLIEKYRIPVRTYKGGLFYLPAALRNIKKCRCGQEFWSQYPGAKSCQDCAPKPGVKAR